MGGSISISPSSFSSYVSPNEVQSCHSAGESDSNNNDDHDNNYNEMLIAMAMAMAMIMILIINQRQAFNEAHDSKVKIS